MVILLFGPPGCGKGTQGHMILDWLKVKIPSISTGEMLRAEMAAKTPLGLETKAIITSGGLVSDETINTLLARRIGQPDCQNGFMLDGYPRTLDQADYLDRLLAERHLPAPVVIHLDVPADVLVGRIVCRRQCARCGMMFNILSKRPKTPGRCDVCGGHLMVRKDDREDVIRERLKNYEAQTSPVLSHYYNADYCHIPGDRSPVYIFETITNFLEPLLKRSPDRKALKTMQRTLSILLACALPAFPQTPETRLNPTVKQVVDAVSEPRIAAILKKLEGFGTRYVLSAQDDPVHGIGAAKRWIHDELQSYSPRLEVSYQDFTVKKGARQGQIIRDVELSNIVAVLPGAVHKDRYVLVTGHYDSVALVRKPYTGEEQIVAEAVRRGVDASEERNYLKLLPPERPLGPLDFEATASQPVAPGVTDDGSGTAAVMELARVMSQYRFDNTIVFIAFAGEEIGLSGSQTWAAMAKQKGMRIEAVLNNDIIGSDVSGNGRSASSVLRVFAAPPEDSPARELGRYVKQVAERYVPSMQVEMVFRGDRFLRGGDHTPFVNQGYAAVRLTTPSENFDNQHSITDTFANTSVPYTTRVVRMNAAALASLALAPAAPVLNWTWASGPDKGGHVPLLTRGKSGYDAVLHWVPGTEANLAGYIVVMRSTTSPVWERETWVGNVTSYTMADVSIDEVAIGVKAVDKDGNQSLVSPYAEPVLPAMLTPATAK